MKSLTSGLVAAIIVGAIGLIILRSLGTIKLPSFVRTSPTPSASVEPNFELAPVESSSPMPSVSPTPSTTPTPQATNTTKGGVVKGTSTTTTTTITHYFFTLAKSSDCPSTIVSELKDIQAEVSVQYRIHDDFSAAITVWNEKGEELAAQKTYTGNGKIVSTGNAKSIRVLIQPAKCQDVDYNWLEVFASR